jgi:hypothetical protein
MLLVAYKIFINHFLLKPTRIHQIISGNPFILVLKNFFRELFTFFAGTPE